MAFLRCSQMLFLVCISIFLVTIAYAIPQKKNPRTGPMRETNRQQGRANPDEQITVFNGGPWGEWGARANCARGSRATGFYLKVDPFHYKGYDNTALNGIRLICSDGKEIESTTYVYGFWGTKVSCPDNGYLMSFRLKVQEYAGPDDALRGEDTAANDILFMCHSNTGLSSGGISRDASMLKLFRTDNGGPWGTWGKWSDACAETGICGIETRVDKKGSAGDETALNDVRMYCCPKRWYSQ